MRAGGAPAVSVIVPAYLSEATLPACLAGLRRQSFDDFELIVVDSSPVDRAGAVVERELPGARYFHSPVRLLPQAARNQGARHARGELLVFTDPDIYPPPARLEQLVAAHRGGHPVVLGAIACHGDRWLDRGAHLVKFAICLPGGAPREVELGWSGNILIPRALFERLGGWDAAHVQGDSVFTDRVRGAGQPLWFEPRAQVAHDHERLTVRAFARERFRRGQEFAAMELDHVLGHPRWAPRTAPGRLAVAALAPLRAGSAMIRILRVARGAGLARDYLSTLPVVLLGVGAWYAGMTRTYVWRSLE